MALPSFGQMRELYQLQKQAKQMQKELKNLIVEACSKDNLIRVEVNGEMKVRSIAVDQSLLSPAKKTELESLLCETVSQAMSRAQSESATRMQPLLKDLKLPGF